MAHEAESGMVQVAQESSEAQALAPQHETSTYADEGSCRGASARGAGDARDMSSEVRKGWFIIPGVQDGDRTLEQQLQGIEDIGDLCRGKTVLDLGCAEGLISRRVLEAGARSVVGIDVVRENVDEAVRQCAGYDALFVCAEAQELATRELKSEAEPRKFDVVLALAVLHKFRRPQTVLKWVARSTRELCVIRYPGVCPNGVIVDARSNNRPLNVPSFMAARGFRQERTAPGPFGEMTVLYRSDGAH